MHSEKEILKRLEAGEEFASEEVDKIMLENGMPEEKLKEFRAKGYDDDRLLALLRF